MSSRTTFHSTVRGVGNTPASRDKKNSRVDTLIDGLFGNATPTTLEDGAGPRDPSLPGQCPTRMLHLLDDLLFQGPRLRSQALLICDCFKVNWEASLRTENGCLIYDSRQLVTMLKDARAALQRVGSLSAAGADQQLHEETDFILKSAVRKTIFAKSHLPGTLACLRGRSCLWS